MASLCYPDAVGTVYGHPLRLCDQHGGAAEPNSGVQLNPNKWVCGACWLKRSKFKASGKRDTNAKTQKAPTKQ